jgi:hypothetical protein
VYFSGRIRTKNKLELFIIAWILLSSLYLTLNSVPK